MTLSSLLCDVLLLPVRGVVLVFGILPIYLLMNALDGCSPRDERFRVDVQRTFADEAEQSLILIAEGVVPNVGQDGLLSFPNQSMASIIDYLSEEVEKYKKQLVPPGYSYIVTYRAGISPAKNVPNEGDYLVTMELQISHVYSLGAGYGYEARRIVKLSRDGAVLDVRDEEDEIPSKSVS